MTEADWLACSDPAAMLALLWGETTDRKLRLYACAAWRWRYTRSAPWLLRKTLFRGMLRPLERAERSADGLAGPMTERWWGTFFFAMPSAWQAANATVGAF